MRKIWNSKDCSESTKIIGYFEQMGVKGCSPQLQKEWSGGEVKHRSNLWDLSTVSDGDLADLAIPGPKEIHVSHNVHALSHLAKDHILAIQPHSLGSADENMGVNCVGANICHGQDARTHMLQDETLINKILPIDGLATSDFMAYEVTTLAHKSQNYSAKAGLACNKSSTNNFWINKFLGYLIFINKI